VIAFDSEVAAVVRFVVDNTNHDVVKLMNILGHVRQCTWCAQGSWKSTFKKSVRTMSQAHFSGPFESCKKKGGYTGPTVVDVVENVENGVVESGDSTNGEENGEETERESGGEMPLESPMGGNLGTTSKFLASTTKGEEWQLLFSKMHGAATQHLWARRSCRRTCCVDDAVAQQSNHDGICSIAAQVK